MRRNDQPVTEIIKASDARQHWSELLNRVFKGETRALVEKSGIPVAAVISAADFERLQQLESQRRERFKALEETWEAFADLPADAVEQAVAHAIAEVRAEYDAQDDTDQPTN